MRRSKFLKLTQFVRYNLKECGTPNKPETIINSPESANTDTNLSSNYIFKDIFNENKIKETLNQQIHLIEKIPTIIGLASTYIMK